MKITTFPLGLSLSLALSLPASVVLAQTVADPLDAAASPLPEGRGAAAQPGVAVATPAGAGEADPAGLEEAVTITIKTRPVEEMRLPPGEILPIELDLTEFPEAPADLPQKVRLAGHARMVEHGGKRYGQVLLSAASLPEDTDRVAVFPGEGFSSQFTMDAAALAPGQELEVTGSREELLAALRALLAEEQEDEQGFAPEQEAGDDPAMARTGSNSGPGREGDATQYQTPAPVAAAQEPVIGSRITREGCTIRIDVAQQVAVVQSRTIIMEDGVVQDEGSCTDSEVRYPLQKDYGGCADLVDLEAMEARSRYKMFFVDENGVAQTISSACVADDGASFSITEDHESCTVFTDFADGVAVPQAALVYLDRNNNRIEARDCAASATKEPVPMAQEARNCGLRHDFAKGHSTRLAMWTYMLDGVAFQATPCTDTDVVYQHTALYKDESGAWLCPRLENVPGGTVVLQSRVRITAEGAPSYITECTPDASTTALSATTDGCEYPEEWTHDLSAGISYGQERFYFEHDGKREFVTECTTSSASYRHDVTTIAHDNHDDSLFAYPISRVTIAAPSGAYVVADNRVLAGAAQIPYRLTGSGDRPNGAKQYQGCDAYTVTETIESYERPDGTTFERVIGRGERTGPVNACRVTGVTTRSTGNMRYSGCYATGEAERIETRTRDDGATFTRSLGTTSSGGSRYACRTGSTTWSSSTHSCTRARQGLLREFRRNYWVWGEYRVTVTCQQSGRQAVTRDDGTRMPSKTVTRSITKNETEEAKIYMFDTPR